jgi:hypothetical protein
MSKINPVYDAIICTIGVMFPGKTRLHNPYNIEKNPELIMKDSWGLRVDGASIEEDEFCNLTTSRSFTFILLRNFVSLEGKEEGFDAVSVYLLEDQQSFMSRFYSTDQIGQQSNIDRILITNISGIQEMTSGEKKYLFNEVTFTITISELIS